VGRDAWTRSNTAIAYTANGLNQYTATSVSGTPVAYTYDANGNLLTDGKHSFVYDVENRLVSATGAHTAELVYDPLGRLVQVSSGGANPRRLIYDGDALIGEYDAAGAMTHRYVHGDDAGADDPIIWYDNIAPAPRQLLLHDHQGSIVAVTDPQGNAVAANSYDPWGIPGPTNKGRFGYTGQAWLPELGLWYYKARVYSPTLGRFLQVDPIGYEGGINLYGYGDNDPVNNIDSDGKNAVPIGSCVANSNGLVTASCASGAVAPAIGAERSEMHAPKAPSQAATAARRPPPDPTGGDGHLSLGEANRHFREGNGRPVDVDASKLSVTLDREPRRPGETVGATVRGIDFAVHGKVPVTLQRDGTYRMVDGPYDFDISSRRGNVRNTFTAIGSGVATNFKGGGTSFQIRYHGSPTVYTPNMRVYNRCSAHPGSC
jgi:RHS repeat-associated protein